MQGPYNARVRTGVGMSSPAKPSPLAPTAAREEPHGLQRPSGVVERGQKEPFGRLFRCPLLCRKDDTVPQVRPLGRQCAKGSVGCAGAPPSPAKSRGGGGGRRILHTAATDSLPRGRSSVGPGVVTARPPQLKHGPFRGQAVISASPQERQGRLGALVNLCGSKCR